MRRISKLIKQTVNKFSKLYKIYIKDEFTIQVKKWFADREIKLYDLNTLN